MSASRIGVGLRWPEIRRRIDDCVVATGNFSPSRIDRPDKTNAARRFMESGDNLRGWRVQRVRTSHGSAQVVASRSTLSFSGLHSRSVRLSAARPVRSPAPHRKQRSLSQAPGSQATGKNLTGRLRLSWIASPAADRASNSRRRERRELSRPGVGGMAAPVTNR